MTTSKKALSTPDKSSDLTPDQAGDQESRISKIFSSKITKLCTAFGILTLMTVIGADQCIKYLQNEKRIKDKVERIMNDPEFRKKFDNNPFRKEQESPEEKPVYQENQNKKPENPSPRETPRSNNPQQEILLPWEEPEEIVA